MYMLRYARSVFIVNNAIQFSKAISRAARMCIPFYFYPFDVKRTLFWSSIAIIMSRCSLFCSTSTCRFFKRSSFSNKTVKEYLYRYTYKTLASYVHVYSNYIYLYTRYLLWCDHLFHTLVFYSGIKDNYILFDQKQSLDSFFSATLNLYITFQVKRHHVTPPILRYPRIII